ncbi:hypothetical protein MUG87_00715 [Ectobacillus sp. JY-23]|uniref:lipopolysaccharide biosynthesis protein n=1 Tax=Ectobacillus sp. JY-23 TaxID=2933872 RepID=UPI001FF4E919|nr:hypothetical protein [Ectobacillus sp. JY-23]UOY92706.1 hypothetical protein MUG87_00715 [Ectobacillus sp. JY-23]
MRIKHSLINISTGLVNQIIITSLSFISRTVFIYTLGVEYLGINGLLTNILAMLSLAEAGIGASIMYSLYKPVADNNQEKISVLMHLYKRAYVVIALVVLLLGLALLPFLNYFIKDSKVEHVHVIYLIFLFNTVAPYFYLHKNSFLNVCQKGYIVTITYSVSAILSTGMKIGILHFTKNYILYLAIDSIITVATSIILARLVNKRYPFLKKKVTGTLDEDTKTNIIKNIKAIVLQNVGNYLIVGTDNIIISSFVSVAAVGLYSNYYMLIEICRNFTYQIFNNMYHSIGNLVAKESIEKVYNIYNVYLLLNFWLYSFFSILLCIILDPFITLWIGSKFLLSKGIVIVLMLSFYERGMRNAITTIKTTAGVFYADRYGPLIQAVINLAVSIILVKEIGLIGVFMGTLISALVVPFWLTPYLVYKHVFRMSVTLHFIKYTFYGIIGSIAFILTGWSSTFIEVGGWGGLTLRIIVCICIPNTLYFIIFRNTKEFQYLQGIIIGILGTTLKKIKNRGIVKPGM